MIKKLICQDCGNVFQFNRDSTGPLPSFCDKCQAKKPVANMLITCKECGKEFPFQTSVGKPPRFCSPICRATYLKNYQREYFQKRHYDEPAITLRIHMNRINKQPCIRCDNEHSITAQMIPHHEEIGNMIPLCTKCSLSLFLQEWDISEIEDKLKEQYPDQYWWLQIEKSENHSYHYGKKSRQESS